VLAAGLWAVGKPLFGPTVVPGSRTGIGETFRKDVLIEAQAELAHEATGSLKRIRVPVLIAGGQSDFAFPVRALQEMAALIPTSTLKIYPGGHFTAILDKRFAQDVREFTRRPRATTL
jgi:pimeloyl-ACP methyl ester carboxylesterase